MAKEKAFVLCIVMILILAGCISGLTAEGGRCGGTHCSGSAVAETKSSAKTQAIGYLNEAMSRHNCCTTEANAQVVKEKAQGSSYYVKVQVRAYNCATAGPCR